MSDSSPVVFVVDDDLCFARSVCRLLRTAGFRVECFASAEQFLRCRLPDAPACLLLDVEMPGRSGLELQADLAAAGSRLPIVFLTGRGDIPMAVHAVKGGATNFLTKPAPAAQVLSAVAQAIAQDREASERRRLDAAAGQRAGALTPRERQVLALVVAGKLNKQIASQLGVAEKTIKIHRSRGMEKMQARSLPELVRIADAAGIGAR